MRELNNVRVAIIDKGDVWEENKYNLVLMNTNMTINRPSLSCPRRLYEILFEKDLKDKFIATTPINIQSNASTFDRGQFEKHLRDSVNDLVTPTKSVKNKSERYSFIATKPEDIDLERIVREVKEDNANSIGFILTINPAKGAVVCLFPNTVRDFIPTDRFNIGGRYVDPSWGTWIGNLSLTFDGDEYVIVPNNRGKYILKVMVISKSEIAETVKTLKAMKEYKRRIKVKVNPI